MGGRGSAGGISDRGIKYGTEYHTVLAIDNIKFISRNEGAQNSPLETMSAEKNRVYVIVRPDKKIKSIVFYDKNGKKTRQIDFDHEHGGQKPHAHIGYDGKHAKEPSSLTATDKKYIKKVKEAWEAFTSE